MQSFKIKGSRFMLSTNTERWLLFAIRIACIFLMLFSGYEKIATHDKFLKGLEKVAIVGEYAVVLSWAVPIMELIIGILLLIKKTVKLGLIGFIILMLAFTFYITSVILWADIIPCNCNILVKQLSWPQHILFNLGFIFIAAFALSSNKKNNF